MPYSSNKELPEFVRKYSTKVQSQWREVFNSVYSRTNDESRAFKAANSVLKKRITNNKGVALHRDKFAMEIDTFLGNLKSL